MGKVSPSQLAQTTCVVRCCPRQDQTSFFRIPAAKRNDWIRICGLDPSKLNTLSRVCNLHFRDEDFLPRTQELRRLRPGVVPSQWVPETQEEEPQSGEGPETQQPSTSQSASTLEDRPDSSQGSVNEHVLQDSPGGPLYTDDLIENLNNSAFEPTGEFNLLIIGAINHLSH